MVRKNGAETPDNGTEGENAKPPRAGKSGDSQPVRKKKNIDTTSAPVYIHALQESLTDKAFLMQQFSARSRPERRLSESSLSSSVAQ
jgi:hypothetical protein